MPRAKSHTRDDLIAGAMQQFWRHGYQATSVDDLVQATGVSRHGLYAATGCKHGLFVACLGAYIDAVVTPAFAQVETPTANITDIAVFFEFQIARGATAGLPGAGCLMANTMTEMAPHDTATAALVRSHNERLARGFRGALTRSATRPEATLIAQLAETLVVFANGLWSMSRIVADAGVLRQATKQMLQMIEQRIMPCRP
jgi:TetR/AcrR family transcriptional regulator, transcriptional repressor for nem operon